MLLILQVIRHREFNSLVFLMVRGLKVGVGLKS